MPEHSSSRVKVSLPGGREVEVAAGTVAGELLHDALAKESAGVLAAVWDGAPIDLAHPITHPGALSPLRFEDPAGREVFQHSSAHLVAKALTELIPEAKPVAGPPTEDGFYYDFEVRPLTPADLPALREKISDTVRRGDRFERVEVSKSEARKLASGNAHKLRYIEEVPDGQTVSFYRTGSFLDLCRGPHVPDAGWLKGVEILGYSGVTLGEGSAARSFQRIRGVGFPTRADLDTYLKRRADAEARDHRIIGPRQELFSFADEIPGFPFWHPKGMIVIRELERFVREHLAEAGYSEIRTPLMYPQSVYELSGHWEHFRQDMFLSEIEDRKLGVKPMNCPGSMMIFRSRSRSYRELPMRLAEFAPLHRLEASGTIHGLTRAREFVQDDAHVFVSEDQIVGEVQTLFRWIQRAMQTFQLEWRVELSTRPPKFLGLQETWDRAETYLKQVLDESGAAYKVAPGEGAFYGPKIDIHLRDSMGRSWQCGTIQLDFQMPSRFGLQFQGADGGMHTPIVIHRVILGTWERFLGVLLEHCAGWLPPWLAPVQIRVLPVTERQSPLVEAIVAELRGSGLRAEPTDSQATLSKRIREAELAHVPYIAVVGDQEAQAGTVALRVHGHKGQQSLARPELLRHLGEKIASRSFEP